MNSIEIVSSMESSGVQIVRRFLRKARSYDYARQDVSKLGLDADLFKEISPTFKCISAYIPIKIDHDKQCERQGKVDTRDYRPSP